MSTAPVDTGDVCYGVADVSLIVEDPLGQIEDLAATDGEPTVGRRVVGAGRSAAGPVSRMAASKGWAASRAPRRDRAIKALGPVTTREPKIDVQGRPVRDAAMHVGVQDADVGSQYARLRRNPYLSRKVSCPRSSYSRSIRTTVGLVTRRPRNCTAGVASAMFLYSLRDTSNDSASGAPIWIPPPISRGGSSVHCRGSVPCGYQMGRLGAPGYPRSHRSR